MVHKLAIAQKFATAPARVTRHVLIVRTLAGVPASTIAQRRNTD